MPETAFRLAHLLSTATGMSPPRAAGAPAASHQKSERNRTVKPFFYTIFIFRRAVLSLFIDWTRVYFWGVGFLKLCDAK